MLDNSDIQDNLTNEDSYDSLVATIEASQGFLTLLIASCEPGLFQNQLIGRYEAELAPEIPSYRIRLNQLEPSLRGGLEELVNETPQLKLPKASGVITVTGAADLEEMMGASHFGKDTLFLTKFLPTLPPLSKGGARIQSPFLPNRDAPEMTLWETEEKSPLDKFFGYLQWTREGLRAFPYPIVLWVTPKILTRLSMASPDFWSWRSGVFRFVSPVREETTVKSIDTRDGGIISYEKLSDLPLDELLEQINQIEKIEKSQAISPLLATLYDRVGQAYTNQVILGKSENRQWEIEQAIEYFQKAITLQTNLNLKADRVNSLRRLGNFYYDRGQYKEAELFHKEAIEIARQIGDISGEAASLVSLGNSYQQHVLGNRAENLELAIAAYHNALLVL
ncbi:tetratricopeptide repeat protein, partial [Limnofasciculus baicalensis]